MMPPAVAAATTYTPTGGPIASFVATGLNITLIEPVQTITCTTVSMGGPVQRPGASRVYSADAVTLDSFGTTGCHQPILGPTAITAMTRPTLAMTGDSSGGQWPARMKNVTWAVHWPNCDLFISGVINGKFDPATQLFTPNAGAVGLTIANTPAPPTGSFCVTFDFQAGDTVALSESFLNTAPAQAARGSRSQIHDRTLEEARMRRKTLRLMAGVALAMVVVVGGALDARAGTTYTPSGGTGLNLVASYQRPGTSLRPGLVLTFLESAQDVTCTSFSVAGSVVSPGVTRSYGAAAATLSTASATCSNPILGPMTLTQVGAPSLTVTGDATGAKWPVRLTGVQWQLTWPNCDFRLAGYVDGTLDAATQVFTPLNPTGLTIASTPPPLFGAYCVALDFQVGDHVALTGTFKNTPPAGSTALSIS